MIRTSLSAAAGLLSQAAGPSLLNPTLQTGAAWALHHRLRLHSSAPLQGAPQAATQPKDEPYVAPHPSIATPSNIPASLKDTVPFDVKTVLANPVYTRAYLESVKPYHVPPKTRQQKVGYAAVQTVRRAFDLATGYGPNMTEAQWLRRIIFLETVAGVPGMVAGMLRHLRSLRTMQQDNGWINTLLAEAENERMHLLTFMNMRKPGPVFRGMVILAQGVLCNMFFLAYLASPKTCHAAVGYLEEEAVKTYTHALKDIDSGKLWAGVSAPAMARTYWRLPDGSDMKDLVLAVRADEACHSHVNHTFSQIKPDEPNPFGLGSHEVP